MKTIIILLTSLPLCLSVNAAQEAPKIPGLTTVKSGVKVQKIKSDPFTMSKVAIEGGVLKITVSYGGGGEKHEFTCAMFRINPRPRPEGDEFAGNAVGNECYLY